MKPNFAQEPTATAFSVCPARASAVVNPDIRVMHRSVYSLLAALAVSLMVGCSAGSERGPKAVTFSDTNIAPMLKAIEAVDRAAIGFTPIQTNADIRLETVERQHWGQGYQNHRFVAKHGICAWWHRRTEQKIRL